MLHPQDFAIFTKNNGSSNVIFINSIDRNELSDLIKILNDPLSNNIRVAGFEQIIEM